MKEQTTNKVMLKQLLWGKKMGGGSGILQPFLMEFQMMLLTLFVTVFGTRACFPKAQDPGVR